ncbi:MAG: glycerol-3-phosphate acyltransferase [Anaerolineales bacterium]|jgi:glycerol-3-phosphate acyltransferase PlsY|uniref:glycerol-3-phosphate acyltransferase n=1 Tax=Candidatus Villigracilis vicinus TaxID=3140679 RepID=UPI00313587BB|nr:glycerol-3-phosphate acyltransferase [Anaerolineales bacterium]MBK7449437.1 glycerol-3-phosphate acyltransferase [Anaerolineales bacterium]MBK9780493.1 glycerol-3-phosphate acyltransferase [Anaerolineales bacterium]
MMNLLFPLLGYFLGSLPFSIWVTRFVKNVDVRDAGSGHATTTNTIRQAGFGWGVLVFILDVTKGFLPAWLAIRYSGETWLIALTAACAVIGHCWTIFAGFRGGMGLATAGGSILAVNPLAFLVCFGLLVFLVLVVRHSARASVFAGILIAPVLWLLNFRDVVFWVALGTGAVIAIRFLIDWNRKYRELWLDREKPG